MLKKYFQNPLCVFLSLGRRGLFNWMSDERYLKFIYFCIFHKKLNLKDPKSFNEKLQWLKLYDRNPKYSIMVDKYEAKKYVADIIGEQYIIPTLGVWDRFEDIDFETLPNQFVLKCTHDSNGLVICKDKTKLDIQAAKQKINKCLKRNFYNAGREWPYKNVKPRIIAEVYMEDESGDQLKDYKILNFNGEPKIIQLDFNRFKGHLKKIYNTNWEQLPLEFNYPSDMEHNFPKPEALEKMLELSRILSASFPFLRTDFYLIENNIYFGELTFFPASGFGGFKPNSWDLRLGAWIKLPENHKK